MIRVPGGRVTLSATAFSVLVALAHTSSGEGAAAGDMVNRTDRPAGPSCNVVTIGNDPSHGNTTYAVPLGRAANQVFFAPDTLISSITIWKPAQPESLVNPMHLFITETDSLAMDSTSGWRPLPNAILLDGPIVNDWYTDGINNKPVMFSFDPPFVLPRRGYFSFAIKEDLCGGVIALLGDTQASYPNGGLWKTVANRDCSELGESARLVPGDLIFQVVFCDAGVAVMTETWGRVKVRYR